MKECGARRTWQPKWADETRCSLLGSYADGKCWHHSDTPEAIEKRRRNEARSQRRRRRPREYPVRADDLARLTFGQVVALKAVCAQIVYPEEQQP